MSERERWGEQLNARLGVDRVTQIDRVVVLDEVGSTQDAAYELCGGRAGMAVTALRQTAGRGRLGRAWGDTSAHGVAITYVLDGARFDDARLSLAAGHAALLACVDALRGERAPARLGIRWPNDVVERDAPGRKVAGVLIERRGGLALLGVGINVTQPAGDWAEELRGRAVSIRELGGWRVDRACVCATLTKMLDRSLAEPTGMLEANWKAANTLIGSCCSFVHDSRMYEGEVIDIDPANAIRLRKADGSEVSLPARTTSMVHE